MNCIVFHIKCYGMYYDSRVDISIEATDEEVALVKDVKSHYSSNEDCIKQIEQQMPEFYERLESEALDKWWSFYAHDGYLNGGIELADMYEERYQQDIEEGIIEPDDYGHIIDFGTWCSQEYDKLHADKDGTYLTNRYDLTDQMDLDDEPFEIEMPDE